MSNNTSRLKSYNSYSGCDMVATLQISSHTGIGKNIYTLGSLQTISISTHQDKRPVRSLGNINAKDYTMGQRTIAGSLVFAVFDKHFADQMFKDSIETINQEANAKISTIMLPDELPPFDITISYANEYGHTSRMALYGVRLINEGQVMSINDIYTENTYQFVATALEPLNKDENVGTAKSSNQRGKITPSDKVVFDTTSNIDTIVNNFNNGGDLYSKSYIYLSVETENPNTITDLGVAKFSLDPHQYSGEIKIYNAYNELYLIQLDNFPNAKTYSIFLPSGNYYAFYEANDKTSNTVTFKLSSNHIQDSRNNSGPVIDYVTDKEVCILSNNISHDTASCYLAENITKNDTPISTVAIKSRKALFKNLTPNTTYIFITFDSNDTKEPSLPTQSKTLKYDTELIDEFKTYISLNNDIAINNVDDMIAIVNSNKASVKNVHNIIDFALSIKELNTAKQENFEDLKNEIIFFAVRFQNYINQDLNKYASIQQPTRALHNPYYNTINMPVGIEYCNIFKTDRGKSIFKEKVSNVNSYEYIDKSNIRYYAYGINDYSRGAKYDFVCFGPNAISALSDYNDVNNINTISNDTVYNMYPGISNTNLNRLTVEHLKKSNIEYLSKPMITINQDLSLDVCLNYDDCVHPDEELIISFCDVTEALDTVPKKKVKFKFTQNLTINSFYSGIKFNSSYAVWIENSEGFIISKIETFNTYFDNEELNIEDENIKITQLKNNIETIKKGLSKKMDINPQLNDILESEKYNVDSHDSIVYDNLLSNIVQNSIMFNDTFSIIRRLLETKSDQNIFKTSNFSIKAIYNTKENSIQFVSDKKIKISNTYIDDVGGEISKSVIATPDNKIMLDHKSGYTIVFCIPDGLYVNSGFIVVDNLTKRYAYYDLSTEVI